MAGSARPIRVLILGGTAEARSLAQTLAGQAEYEVIVSLAGRTAAPLPHAAPVRRGGFGGAEGLASYIRDHRIDVLIDATHPFATGISANAVRAAGSANVKLIALRRPPWEKVAGDNWTEVESVEQAVIALGQDPKRVFVALGRNELQPFAAAPQHFYLVRSVDPVDPPLAVPDAVYIAARGPFSEAEDRALLARHKIEMIVAKNSGGAATYSKIEAARTLGVPVIMLKRPALPEAVSTATVEEVFDALDHALTLSTARGV